MKYLLFFVVFILVIFAMSMPSSHTVSDEDLTFYLEEYPELYNYTEWHISNRKDTEFEDYIEIELAYRYKRTAKTHVAVIKGVSISVDNDFVNNCIDHPTQLEWGENDCSFVTEIGTMEDVKSDHTTVVVDKWGVLSRDNVQTHLLSKKTYSFLTGLFRVFRSEKVK